MSNTPSSSHHPNPAQSIGSREADALANPFTDDVCTGPFEVSEAGTIEGLNRETLDRLTDAIDERQRTAGRAAGQPLMLLTAPRAGYGKTHLLGRLAEASGRGVVLLPLAFRLDDEIGWPATAFRACEALARAPGRRPGWSRLREVSAGVCAALLLRLIEGGKLPCANPEQAMRVLASDPSEIFSETGSARLIGEWLRKHVSQLRKPLADTAAQMSGVSQGDLEEWIQAFLNHAGTGDGKSSASLSALASADRLSCEVWLRLLALWKPVIVLVDHLDGFYRDERAGLRIAMLLLDMADIVGVHVVLSLNQDVWQATFGHHLPSALEDRLTASQVLLRGLGAEEAESLVRLRLQEAGVAEGEAAKFARFLDARRYFLGRPVGSVSVRNFLRHAAAQWQIFSKSSAFETGPGSGGGDDEETGPPALLPVIAEPAPPAAPPAAKAPEPRGVRMFDAETTDYMKRVAEGLAEPSPALPQQDTAAPVVRVALPPASPPSPAPKDVAAMSTLGAAATLKNQGAFEKLREMLDKLRAADAQAKTEPSAAAPSQANTVASRLSNLMSGGPVAESHGTREALLGRFEALRLQMGAEADSRPLDMSRVMDLIRLAGKRFPLVQFAEVELPGLTGHTAAKWTLQGNEIIFGVGDFTDPRYWKVLAGFGMGRLSALSEQAKATGEPAPQFKLVAFKSEREAEAWGAIWRTEIFPSALRAHVDAVHLDTRSIAALYAMHRMIKEAESGALRAEPAHVISVLARELDFFWKRVTRPLSGAR